MNDDTTPTQHLPLPHPRNRLNEDVVRLRAALGDVDAALDALQKTAAVLQQEKANNYDIDALQKETASTIKAINSSISNISNGLLGREPSIATGNTTHYWRGDKTWQTLNSVNVKRVLELSNYATLDTPFQAGKEYALYAVSPYSRPLPANPSVGDTIVLHNSHHTWGSDKCFTLKLGNSNHRFRANNGKFFYTDILFDTNDIMRVTLIYVYTNWWDINISF